MRSALITIVLVGLVWTPTTPARPAAQPAPPTFSSLVMWLPREKILFAVDFIPMASVPGRGMIDSYPLEWEASLKEVLAMDWERLIPGHPAPGGRLGTKQDVQNLLTFLQDASAAVKTAAREGKCWEPAEKELTLRTYESWAGYTQGLPFVLRRYCRLWGRGTCTLSGE
jgi:hypothetical protein